MKNTKEVQAILTAICCINQTSDHRDDDIAKICDYAFRRLFGSKPKLIALFHNSLSYCFSAYNLNLIFCQYKARYNTNSSSAVRALSASISISSSRVTVLPQDSRAAVIST